MKMKLVLGMVLALAMALPVAANEFVDGYEAAEEHEYQVAMQKWERLAKKGDHKALFMLGMMYHSGIAGQQDEKTAVKLYEKAAEKGNLVAQEYMATAYREGWFGLKKDGKKAKYWEKKLEQVGNLR